MFDELKVDNKSHNIVLLQHLFKLGKVPISSLTNEQLDDLIALYTKQNEELKEKLKNNFKKFSKENNL